MGKQLKWVVPVWRPPYWIFHFRFDRATFHWFHWIAWPRKHVYIAVEISFLSCLGAEVCGWFPIGTCVAIIYRAYSPRFTVLLNFFRLMPAILDSPQTLTSKSIRISSNVLLNSVGISLLPCVQAEVYVISYSLPVSGHHRWFAMRLVLSCRRTPTYS